MKLLNKPTSNTNQIVINEVIEVVKDQTMETKEREKRLNNVIISNNFHFTYPRYV